MRKSLDTIVLLIFSLLVLSGCAKEDASGVPDGSCPVTFTAVSENQAADTRGTVVSPSGITGTGGTGIGVFAFYQKAKSNGYPTYFNSSTGSPNFMANQQVTTSDSGTTWTYSPLKYWPNSTGDQLSFFAYAPYDVTTAWEDLGVKANLAGTEIKRHYAVSGDVSDQQDRLWADPLLNISKPGVSPRLAFSFSHLCARVYATCKVDTYSDSDCYIITRVAISGKFCTGADLVYDVQTGTRSWENREEASTVEYELFRGSQTVTATETPVGAADNCYAFLLPVTCDVTLTVDYTRHTASSDTPGTMTTTFTSTELVGGEGKNFVISFTIN